MSISAVLLNKTYPTDIKTIVNLKNPTKPNLMLRLNYQTRGQRPLGPPLLPERPKSNFRNGWGKFCSIVPAKFLELTIISVFLLSKLPTEFLFT